MTHKRLKFLKWDKNLISWIDRTSKIRAVINTKQLHKVSPKNYRWNPYYPERILRLN